MQKRTRLGLAFVVAIIALAFIPGSAATTLSFRSPLRLARWAGSEPSVAIDPAGSYVYVVAPQAWPAAFAKINDTSSTSLPKGIALWTSPNGGLSFTRNGVIGSSVGGGDTDVSVDRNGRVYVVDLEVAAASVCSSPRGGTQWTSMGLPQQDNCYEGVPFSHQGPSDDRPWIAVGPAGEVYFVYHELATGFPIIKKSTDGGKTFLPCGSLFDPQGPAGQNYNPVQGTLIAKPVIGKDGSIYVTISEPEQTGNPADFRISRLFVAVAQGGCSPTTVFKNYTIYSNTGADFKLFNQVAMDGGGVLYAVASGRTKTGQTGDNVWLFVSKNKGKTWSIPIRVNPTSLKGNVMPAVAGGLRANQVAVGWFGTTVNGDPGHTRNIWRYYAATSIYGGGAFQVATVTPGPIHYGDICTDGLLCDVNGIADVGCQAWDIFAGIVTDDACPSPASRATNRNLYDFSSIAVNPKTGCVMAVFPGDPHNRPDIGGNNDFTSYAYVSTQSGGTCLR